MNRSIVKRIPGRLAFGGRSFYAKLGTTIDRELNYSQQKVGAAGIGNSDNRDSQAYYKIMMTPDGRLAPADALVLWPYNNPVIGTGIFNPGDAADTPALVHGNDSSLDTLTNAALTKQPTMTFHPEKTLIGQIELTCLRGLGKNWSDANSLITEADAGGTFYDAAFGNSSIVTQDYTMTWGGFGGVAGVDFYDGLTFEPGEEWQDDEVAVHGLFNRHIKNVSGILRGIPLGQTREVIQTQLKIQGPGAARGSSGAAKAFPLAIKGADGLTYLSAPLAQLVKSKIQNGVEQLREGEVAWEFIRPFAAGVPGALYTVPVV